MVTALQMPIRIGELWIFLPNATMKMTAIINGNILYDINSHLH